MPLCKIYDYLSWKKTSDTYKKTLSYRYYTELNIEKCIIIRHEVCL